MITGIYTRDREARVRLQVLGSKHNSRQIEAIIDTGFTGYLTLPSATISSLGLGWRGREQAVLADGSLQQFDVYAGRVRWGTQIRTVEVDACNYEPLIGMSLIEGHELRIQAVEGGLVTIEPVRFA